MITQLSAEVQFELGKQLPGRWPVPFVIDHDPTPSKILNYRGEYTFALATAVVANTTRWDVMFIGGVVGALWNRSSLGFSTFSQIGVAAVPLPFASFTSTAVSWIDAVGKSPFATIDDLFVFSHETEVLWTTPPLSLIGSAYVMAIPVNYFLLTQADGAIGVVDFDLAANMF